MTDNCMEADKLRKMIKKMEPGESVVYFTGNLACARGRASVDETAEVALIAGTAKYEDVVIDQKSGETTPGEGLGVLTQRRVKEPVFEYIFTKAKEKPARKTVDGWRPTLA